MRESEQGRQTFPPPARQAGHTRKARALASSSAALPREPTRHRCLCPTCYQEPCVPPVASVARLPQQSSRRDRPPYARQPSFRSRFAKTSIPIPGLPSCAVGPSAARLHFRQRERWRILSRVGVESWLDDPGTNRPRGTVVPPTSMKGVLPWTTSLCAMRANFST